MKKILFTAILSLGIASLMVAQDKVWTMEECMQYAVENSPVVKKKEYAYDTNKADRLAAIASFLPSIGSDVTARYNYGRSIDPETNTYKNTTTFNNYYNAYTSIPLFNGGRLVNQWRLSKVNVKAGDNDIQKAKDDQAIKTMAAFVDVVYYRGTVRYAAEKLEESKKTLYKTTRQEELGLKGKSDKAQFEAQVAEDEYILINNQNLYNTAMLSLKEVMNYPYDQELVVDTLIADVMYLTPQESIAEIYDYATVANPVALQVEFSLKSKKMLHLIEKGRLFPTISFNAGISTSYYDNLKSDVSPASFKNQFKNNRGEYIGVSLSFPIFSRLERVTDIRRARNNVRIAEQEKAEILRQLQTTIEKAVHDRDGYAKEAVQMDKKEKADALSYQITLRKYEEGLMSPIDLQTTANTLLMSRANLLQRKLMYLIKCKEVEYYKGIPLVQEVK